MNNVLGRPDQQGLGSFVIGKSYKQQEYEREVQDREDCIAEYTLLRQRCKEIRIDKNRNEGLRCKYSRGELKCDLALARFSRHEKAVKDLVLEYQFANHAHCVFTNTLSATPRITAKLFSDLAETRQFKDRSQIVPRAQRGRTMWARAFRIMEKCAEAESLFAHLQSLFHNCTDNNVSRGFSCREQCQSAVCEANVEKREQLYRHCVGQTLFGQFYVPICFVRRNALHRETCLSDDYTRHWSLQRPPMNDKAFAEQTEFRDKQRLFDVQLLTIAETMHLALEPLRHPAAMFAFPVASVSALNFEQAEREDSEQQAKKSHNKTKKKKPSAPTPLYTACANSELYDKRPENMAHRCANTPQWNVAAKKALEQEKRRQERREQDEAEWEAIQRADDNNNASARERHEHKKQFFERYAVEQESSRDGVHNCFSEERIEVYQTVVDVDEQSATSIYARYNTTHRTYSTDSRDDAAQALFDFLNVSNEQVAAEFAEFCQRNQKAILLESGAKKLCFDRMQTLRLYACFCHAKNDVVDKQPIDKKGSNSSHTNNGETQTLVDVVGERIAQQMRDVYTTNIVAQTETPNFRAWGACVLQQLDDWLDMLLSRVLRPAAHWNREKTPSRGKNKLETSSSVSVGDSGSTNNIRASKQQQQQKKQQQHTTFEAFERDCVALLPWLFTKSVQSQRGALKQPSVQQLLDANAANVERRMLGVQFEANCARIWSLSAAVDYFNRKIAGSLLSNSLPHNTGAGNWHNSSCAQSQFEAALQHIDTLVHRSLHESDTSTLVESQPELHALLSAEQRLIERRQKSMALWTICCEPLAEGSPRFTVPRDNERRATLPGASIGKRRDLNECNPYVQFHSFVWSVFRRTWDITKHSHFPQVASFADAVVSEYARLAGQTLPRLAFYDRQNPYLLLSNAKQYDMQLRKQRCRKELTCGNAEATAVTATAVTATAAQDENSHRRIAAHMRKILIDFDNNVWQPKLQPLLLPQPERQPTRPVAELLYEPRESNREAQEFVEETLCWHAFSTKERTLPLYQYSRPFATLYSYMQLQRLRRMERKRKTLQNKSVVTLVKPHATGVSPIESKKSIERVKKRKISELPAALKKKSLSAQFAQCIVVQSEEASRSSKNGVRRSARLKRLGT